MVFLHWKVLLCLPLFVTAGHSDNQDTLWLRQNGTNGGVQRTVDACGEKAIFMPPNFWGGHETPNAVAYTLALWSTADCAWGLANCPWRLKVGHQPTWNMTLPNVNWVASSSCKTPPAAWRHYHLSTRHHLYRVRLKTVSNGFVPCRKMLKYSSGTVSFHLSWSSYLDWNMSFVEHSSVVLEHSLLTRLSLTLHMFFWMKGHTSCIL